MTPAFFKETRRRIGWSQTELADSLGLSLRQIQNFESGKSPINHVHVLALRWIAYDQFSLLLPN